MLEQIEAFFQSDRLEFVNNGRRPSCVLPPAQDSLAVLYCWKPQVLNWIGLENSTAFGWLQCFGFPQREDAELLQNIAGELPILFLCDVDPPDLLTYLYLSDLLDGRVRYLGISDRLLQAIDYQIISNYTIPMREDELEGWELVWQLCPEIRAVIGEECFTLLNSGYKLELEGVFNPSLHDAEKARRGLLELMESGGDDCP